MTTNRLVLRHIAARPLRAVLTTIAIALSVGLVGFLLLLNGALKNDWSENMGQRCMVVAKTSFFEKLPLAYLPKIEDVAGVKRVCPFDFTIGFWRDNRPENQVPIQAAPEDALLDVYIEAKVPKAEADAWKADPTGALVGPVLVNKFHWKVGDRLVLKAPVQGGVVETTVRAIMTYKLDNGVYLHQKYWDHLTGDTGQVAMFWILAKTRDDVPRVTAELERRLDNGPVPIRAMTEKQWQLTFMEMLGNVQLLIGSIGLATAFTLFLITTNTLTMAARERRGEAALLRILGFPRHTILRLLLVEGAAFGAVGGACGLGLMILFGKLVGAALDKTQFAGIGGLLKPDVPVVVTMALLSAGLALGSAVIPGVNLSRRSIVQLLRQT